MLADVQFLPISGLLGYNIKTRMDPKACPWWSGSCLFEVLDSVEVPLRDPKGHVRLISDVHLIYIFELFKADESSRKIPVFYVIMSYEFFDQVFMLIF